MTTVISDYELISCLEQNDDFTLYRAFSTMKRQTVLMKVLTSPQPTAEDISSLVHDYRIAKQITSDGILRPLLLERHQHAPVIIYEPFEGVNLREHLKDRRLNMAAFLQIAIQLASTLDQIHQHHVIHKNIHPRNILIEEHTNRVKLMGFNIATRLSKESQFDTSVYIMEGIPAYSSPEQTGRMNRALDKRTDLYSLGMTFYELLTGRLPFEADDPMEWVHAHIAKMPLPIENIKANVPVTVSEIIMKLLDKAPENRYQSAFGLQKDLERCLLQWRRTGTVEPFTIAQYDNKGKFELPHQLYGRNEEKKALLQAFDRISTGKKEVVLITGAAGIGKTALVGEVQKPLVREKGYFITAKFDQLQRHVPYAPIIHAFRGLVRQLLAEGDLRIASWKQKILNAIAPNGKVITDVLPELEWLIGKQPDVDPLSAVEAQNRFQLVFRQFARVFMQRSHPLVLFLDDLQWADPASLSLLQYILTDAKSNYLLVLLAYRHDVIGLTHPFSRTIDEMKQAHVQVSDISLSSLGEEEVLEWTADTLHVSHEQVRPLAKMLFNITAGNPFFLTQLLLSLYRDQHITFHHESGSWRWQLQHIERLTFDQNIVTFMVQKIRDLHPDTQHVLKMAACIGNRFDLQTLAIICEKSTNDTAQALWQSLDVGLVLPLDPAYKWQYTQSETDTFDGYPPEYRFLHDRVQQAVYSTISVTDREHVHYHIGTLLLNKTDVDDRESRLLDIVNHLNIGRTHITNSYEKIRLAGLNQRAGQRAKESAAFEAALNYFITGLDLLQGDHWHEHHNLTMLLMLGKGECEYLNRRFNEAKQTFSDILVHAKTRAEKLFVYNLQITLFTHVGEYEAAVTAGIRGLQAFGWHIPSKPNKFSLIPEIIKGKWRLGRRQAADLMHLPPMTNNDNRMLMQILINLNAPTYHIDQNLVSLFMLRAFRFTLEHGRTDISALAYNNYALFLSAGFGDLQGSYAFGHLALKMAEENGSTHLKARVYFVFGSYVNHWKNHIKGNLNYLEQSQQYSIEAGNLHLAGVTSSFIVMVMLIQGTPLDNIVAEIDRQLDLANEIRLKLTQDFLTQLRHWLHSLSDPAVDPALADVRTPEDETSKVPYFTLQLQIAYLFNESDLARHILDKLEQIVDSTLVIVTGPQFYFYQSLWLSRMYADADRRQRRRYLKTLHRNSKKMRKWADHCKENYEHKLALMEAEIARIKQDNDRAIMLYEQAIRSADDNGFVQDKAVAYECAANYYLQRNMQRLAKDSMTDAYCSYLQWGANAKAQALKQQYPSLIADHIEESLTTSGKGFATAPLDLNTIMKASQAISKEIVLEQLLQRLMMILVENAGAEKGCLILQRSEGLYIEAVGGGEKQSITVLQSIPLTDYEHVCIAIVHYVAHSQEAIVLADATNEGMFTKDPYVVRERPKSILCMPILFQGKLSGILYLENNMSTHVFTPDRLEMLALLSAQAAISIENARLYAHLEQEVRKRTQELKQTNDNLKMVNAELIRSEQSRRYLLSNISHDLKAPIAAIQGYIELVLDGPVNSKEQERRYLQQSYTRLQGLTRLIKDLFDLSQLETGQLSFNFEYVPVDQLVRRLYEQFEFEVEQAGQHLELHLQPFDTTSDRDGTYPLVKVDPDRLAQVVGNLISNAIKHTTEGGRIRLSCSAAPKPDSASSAAVLIRVQDSGTGISEEDLPYIFDRFYSSKAAKRSSVRGHGIGLAICKEIITAHDGRIWAESPPGDGATFCFTLPVYMWDEEMPV